MDPSWSDLGPSWVPSWADLDLNIVLSPSVALNFWKNHLFDVKTVRRRLWDQLRRAKSPKGAKMTPKRDPGSTPIRPKIDIQIDVNFDAKTNGAGPELARRHWAGNPPQGAPGRRPRDPGEAAQAPRDRPPRPPGTHARVLNTTIIEL